MLGAALEGSACAGAPGSSRAPWSEGILSVHVHLGLAVGLACAADHTLTATFLFLLDCCCSLNRSPDLISSKRNPLHMQNMPHSLSQHGVSGETGEC